MPVLIPVKYHHRCYPNGIQPELQEIAGHMDITSIDTDMPFCLHTEYSYGKRKLCSDLLSPFPSLTASHKDNVPQLWYDPEWAIQFADFIFKLTDNVAPLVIEIHPPFSDYTNSVDTFLKRYAVFEQRILEKFPKTAIVLENRCGTTYRGGHFIISNALQIVELCMAIEKTGLSLQIALDAPQLLSSYGTINRLAAEKIHTIFDNLSKVSSSIRSLHLWGKKKNKNGRLLAHVGNLNTYFEEVPDLKPIFLERLHRLLDDNIARYFVPEVNSNNDDLRSIVDDLIQTGFTFSSIGNQKRN